MLTDLPFDWFILLLRVLFIFLLYFFLYQIVRVTSRELIAIAEDSRWISDRERSAALVTSTYQHIAAGTPLWSRGREFVLASGPIDI